MQAGFQCGTLQVNAKRAPSDGLIMAYCPDCNHQRSPDRSLCVLRVVTRQHRLFDCCRAPRCQRRQTLVAARKNEVATTAAATLTTHQPATAQPDGSVLPSPSSNGSLEAPRLLRGREVEERALNCCIQMHADHPNGLQLPSRFQDGSLDEAYERCGTVTASYAKTFYLGTQLMTPEKAKAVWAVYVWCRRTDELVDGPNASRITPEVCLCETVCGISSQHWLRHMLYNHSLESQPHCEPEHYSSDECNSTANSQHIGVPSADTAGCLLLPNLQFHVCQVAMQATCSAHSIFDTQLLRPGSYMSAYECFVDGMCIERVTVAAHDDNNVCNSL